MATLAASWAGAPLPRAFETVDSKQQLASVYELMQSAER